MVLGFNWLAGMDLTALDDVPESWFEPNGYVKIGAAGTVTLLSPNPEFGQNVKTSMPMRR